MESIAVFGDTHGSIYGFKKTAEAAGLWGKDGKLVREEGLAIICMGDIIADRFPWGREILKALNGATPIAGNHDMMGMHLLGGRPPASLEPDIPHFNGLLWKNYLGFIEFVNPSFPTPKPGEAWAPEQETAVKDALDVFMVVEKNRAKLRTTLGSDWELLKRFVVGERLQWRGKEILFTHTPPTQEMSALLRNGGALQAVNQRLTDVITNLEANIYGDNGHRMLSAIGENWINSEARELEPTQEIKENLIAAGISIAVHGHTLRKDAVQTTSCRGLTFVGTDRKAYLRRRDPSHMPHGPSFVYFGRDGQIYSGEAALEKAAARA